MSWMKSARKAVTFFPSISGRKIFQDFRFLGEQ